MRIPLTPARALGERPELFGPLRADVTDYGNPGVHLGPPRARRRGPGVPNTGEMPPAAGPAPGSMLPRVRLWSFAAQENTGGDALISSPFFNGPALVEHLAIQYDDDNSTPRPTISLWYGDNQPATASNDSSPVTILGTGFFETPTLLSEVANQWQTPIQHLPKWHGAAGSDPTIYPLKFPITLPKFQVTIKMGTQTAGSHVISGYLRVLEADSLEVLAFYM